MLRVNVPFGHKKFSISYNNFDIYYMVSSTMISSYSGAVNISGLIFCFFAKFIMLLTEMSIGCVDAFWEILSENI